MISPVLLFASNSPGGTVPASEAIRTAILRHKAKGTPVAISMANVAASGGYWVSTPGDRLFAEPETITGSIGVIAIVPTFEGLADTAGVNSDGVATTPLTDAFDFIDGFSPTAEAIVEASVGSYYQAFLSRVAQSRKITVARADEVGQGQVWDGGTARQIGLVDQYGGLEDALAWTAAQADLGEGAWYARDLGWDQANYSSVLRMLMGSDAAVSYGRDAVAIVAQEQSMQSASVIADLERLVSQPSAMVRCMECPLATSAKQQAAPKRSWLSQFLALLSR